MEQKNSSKKWEQHFSHCAKRLEPFRERFFSCYQKCSKKNLSGTHFIVLKDIIKLFLGNSFDVEENNSSIGSTLFIKHKISNRNTYNYHIHSKLAKLPEHCSSIPNEHLEDLFGVWAVFLYLYTIQKNYEQACTTRVLWIIDCLHADRTPRIDEFKMFHSLLRNPTCFIHFARFKDPISAIKESFKELNPNAAIFFRIFSKMGFSKIECGWDKAIDFSSKSLLANLSALGCFLSNITSDPKIINLYMQDTV